MVARSDFQRVLRPGSGRRPAGHPLSGPRGRRVVRAVRVTTIESIAGYIYVIRGEQMMVDSDLATLYGVPTSALNQAVTRNAERFPEDFAFKLSREEWTALKSHFVISKTGRGGRRKPPHVFTEQGVAMLSSVLRSRRAAEVNVAIMRTFVRIRRVLGANEDLARKVARHDKEIHALFQHVKALLAPSPQPTKPPIGFIHTKDEWYGQ